MKPKTRLRTVWLVRDSGRARPETVTEPTAWIEKNAKGEIVYGVRASGPTLRRARLEVEREFRGLKDYAETVKNGGGA